MTRFRSLLLNPTWTPALVAVTIAWIAALIVPLVAGAFWPISVASRVWDEKTTVFTSDTISWLPLRGDDWIVQPWLSSLFLKDIYEWFGTGGLSMLSGLLAAVVALAVIRAATIIGVGTLPAAIAAVIMVVVSFPPTLQNQMFATMFFALCVAAVHTKQIWAVPLAIIVWTNMHGSAPIVMTLVLATALGMYGAPDLELSRRVRVLWVAACGAAIFVSPLHINLFDYVERISSIKLIQEVTPIWRPLSLGEWRGVAVALIVLLVIAGWRLRAQSVHWTRVLVVLAYAVLAFKTERHIVWLAVASAPVIAQALQGLAFRSEKSRELRSPTIAIALVIVCVTGVVALFPGTKGQQSFALAITPVELVKKLDKDDRVFASAEWANYVVVESGAKVYLDARLERYQENDLENYLETFDSPVISGSCNDPDKPTKWLIRKRENNSELVSQLKNKDSGVHVIAEDKYGILTSSPFCG